MAPVLQQLEPDTWSGGRHEGHSDLAGQGAELWAQRSCTLRGLMEMLTPVEGSQDPRSAPSPCRPSPKATESVAHSFIQAGLATGFSAMTEHQL